MPWKFTDEDRARLQPLLDKMVRRADYAARAVCKYADSVEHRLELLQIYCEHLGEYFREAILQQVDRGEWSARGINCRDDVSITLTVDAHAAYHDDANLIHLSILPTERLS